MTPVTVKQVNGLWWPQTIKECISIEAVDDCLHCAWNGLLCRSLISLLEFNKAKITFKNFDLLVPRKKLEAVVNGK